MSHTSLFLLGALAMGTTAVAVIFLRLWRDGGDRLFLYFAISFFIQAINRIALAFADSPKEGSALHYTVRLAAYLLIVWAILDKNRPRSKSFEASS